MSHLKVPELQGSRRLSDDLGGLPQGAGSLLLALGRDHLHGKMLFVQTGT